MTASIISWPHILMTDFIPVWARARCSVAHCTAAFNSLNLLREFIYVVCACRNAVMDGDPCPIPYSSGRVISSYPFEIPGAKVDGKLLLWLICMSGGLASATLDALSILS